MQLTYRGPVDYYFDFVRAFIGNNRKPVTVYAVMRASQNYRTQGGLAAAAWLDLLEGAGLVRERAGGRWEPWKAIPLRYIDVNNLTKGPSEELRAWMPKELKP